ncbi:hypothetical protein ACIGNX_34560 [Actinosynnema sp. NPDC053489]|uniref:hypothetical protein n=1 Tax=Actinosynnema sp. NPDC053489 TaxID=3363916 RepID=UPI0037C855C5
MRRAIARSARLLTGLVVVLVAASLAAAPSATAQVVPVAAGSVESGPGPAGDVVGTGDFSALEKVADCNFNLDWPHPSGHVAGNVTSNAVINCNYYKVYMGIETWLYRMGPCGCWIQVAFNEARNDSGTVSYLNSAAATTCVSGTYYAHAEFLMVNNTGDRFERSHETPATAVTC